MIRTIHPFPARMAPDLALDTLKRLPENSIVLDPMSGSGTVIRQAADLGHRPIGFDMDPLAVLMGSVWTTPVDDQVVEKIATAVINEAKSIDLSDIHLPWIDDDRETVEFIDFWFAENQKNDLRRIAFVLYKESNKDKDSSHKAAINILKVAVSRIIVTKEQGASLARDTSHSRPHKVADSSTYNVFEGLQRSLGQVRRRLIECPPSGGAQINLGDARLLHSLSDGSIDAVLTSPPYLNAIDYLRGHRMSLVWLGHRLGDLRTIRSDSIGAERAPNSPREIDLYKSIHEAMCDSIDLPKRYVSMINRYAEDLHKMMAEISRVTKVGGIATFVVGNSCLKGIFIRNSDGVAEAARTLGLNKIEEFERALPAQSRYLPITKEGSLGKRMRTETILSFERV